MAQPEEPSADARQDATLAVLSSTPTAQDSGGARDAASEEADPRVFPVPDWDRYQFISFIGAGGMGKVFKARDPRLYRDVALKFIRTENPVHVRRFVREARAQARLMHENICKVFEVGEVEGQPYIAMQFIDGRSLKAMTGELTREQKVKLIQVVAEAVHSAHRLGLIHRDIKPSNIMIDRDEDGSLRPYVMDFGISREIEASGQTMTWSVEGTPTYMAPEQASGGVSKLDRRSDIYSIGVTLYELLAGRPPFIGSNSIEILFSAMTEDVQPLRKLDASIPKDLETIVMKCLEKEPQARYESAKALADDLQRYLDGDHIQVRRPTWRYLALKGAKKHKALVAGSSVALVLTLVFGGIALRARWRAAEQATLAHQLGQDVEAMELFLRYSYALPLHDAAREKAVVLERMRRIEARMTRTSRAGLGPGHYALGRGHMALHRYNEALSHLEAAWGSDYRTPEVEYAFGLVLGKLYKKTLEDAQRMPDEREREARVKEGEARYLRPALNHVQGSRASRAEVESPLYVEGLIAFYGKRYDEALDKARRAFDASPWLCEAKMLEGEVIQAQGDEKKQRGSYEDALLDYERAREAYKTAEAMARSDATIYQAESKLWRARIEAEVMLGRSPKQSFDQAAVVCDNALKADPDDANEYATKSAIYWWWGRYQSDTGEDPRPALGAAIEAAEQAVARNAEDAGIYDSLGNIYVTMALYESKQGMDPRASLDRAEESLRRAIRINPRFTWPWNDLGTCFETRAAYEVEHGLDPRASLSKAIEHFQAAIATDPAYAYAPHNMCEVLSSQGQYESEIGLDPQASLDRALGACDKTLQINPSITPTHNIMAHIHLVQGKHALLRDQDPRPHLDRALVILTRLVQGDRADIDTYAELGDVHHAASMYLLGRHSDPMQTLGAGTAAAQKMFALGPNEPRGYLLQGKLSLVEGRWAMQRKRDPVPAFRSAASALERALALNLKRAQTYQAVAELYSLWAQHDAGKEGSKELIARGLAAAREALAIHPRMAAALSVQGVLLKLEARMGQSPTAGRGSAR